MGNFDYHSERPLLTSCREKFGEGEEEERVSEFQIELVKTSKMGENCFYTGCPFIFSRKTNAAH